ncbi:hypothetical protein UN64_09285 [Fictibacillus arsenicus]|uniref:Uncharacterized protein n=1 Tax=Fictibacillus arsenicus TaxID=255247 RepID=A0A1V3G780_9BACL|nr:hypothetical protein UN64_09285 [Fictibacillus arsenicus]
MRSNQLANDENRKCKSNNPLEKSERKTLTGNQYSALLENKNRGMMYHTKSYGFCVGYSKNMRIPI